MSSPGYYEPKVFVVPSKLGASPTQKECISILLKKIIEMTQEDLECKQKSRFGRREFLNTLEMFKNSKPLRFIIFIGIVDGVLNPCDRRQDQRSCIPRLGSISLIQASRRDCSSRQRAKLLRLKVVLAVSAPTA